jgi:peroxiredoxin
MAQVESSYEEFTNRNAAVAFIAAQKIDGIFRGKQHVEQKKYRFPVLFDETRKTTRAYGVYHAFGRDAYNLAHPATFVIDANGKICWIGVSPNQSERPAVSDILKAIDACELLS